jgi:hypothetical protein
MSPCSPSSLAPRATFAWKSLVLVTYPIVYHAVRFPLVPLCKTFRSTYPTFFSGHVLCLSCCNQILDITSRPLPTCPFCREPFFRSTVRLIRIDFNRVTPSVQVHHQRKSKGVCPSFCSSVSPLLLPAPHTFAATNFPEYRTPQLTVAALVAPSPFGRSERRTSSRTVSSPQWVGPLCSIARSRTSRVGPRPCSHPS